MKINSLHYPKNSILKPNNAHKVSNNLSFKGESLLNAQTLLTDINMIPYQEYLIDENTVFESSGFKIDLASEDLQNRIKYLRANESLIIGNEAIRTRNMPNTISRRHLRISKNRYGELSACDLNSLNGTKIKANIQTIYPNQGKQKLESGQYYLLPKNAVISAYNEKIHLSNYGNKINSLAPNEKLIIGRSQDADIVIDNQFVSSKHIELRKFADKVLVKDLHSTNGTSFEYCEQTPQPFPIINQMYFRPNGEMVIAEPPANDYRYTKTVTRLKKHLPTKIPQDCQISLGKHFCIDIRNKNILKLLNERGRIEIGRNSTNDIIIDGFYDDASRKHLILERRGNDILATDISSTETDIIPKNQIKAFPNGVNDLVFGQSNIGDCYLLSTLYALSITPEGRKYIEKMVSVDDNGNYIVNFYDSFMQISVAPEDLDGQKMGLSEKRSVCGALGLRAIERAYGRMIRPPREEEMTLFADIDEGGWPENALKKMTGLKSKVHNLKRTNIYQTLYNICSNGFYNHVLTCSTPNNGQYNGCVDPQLRFIKNHAYGIKHIDDRNQTIEIVNPHNTKNSITINWNEFSQYFDYLNVAKLPNSPEF